MFAWYLDEEIDPAGNRILYRYRPRRRRLYIDGIEYSIWSLKFNYEPRPGRAAQRACRFPPHHGAAPARRRAALLPPRSHADAHLCARVRTGAQWRESLLDDRPRLASRDGETALSPELRFEYSDLDFSRPGTSTSCRHLIPPPALDDANTQLVDMTGDGLPDVLAGFGQRHAACGAIAATAGSTARRPSTGVPSTVRLDRPNVALADLDG